MKRWLIGMVAGAWALAGCGEDPESNRPTEDGSVQADGTATDDRGIDRDGTAGDGSTDADVRRDGRVPDMAVVSIESCTDACDRFAACERLEPFGSYDGCLDACAASELENDLTNFFACIEGEACNLVGRCRLPNPPPPPELTCAEACDRIDTCELDLPGFEADCAARCEDSAQRAGLLACAGAQVAACNPEAFDTCLAERVFPACGNRCAASVACNIESADTCLRACVAAGLDADPLRRLRQTERNTCVNTSARDCARINTCLNPAGPAPQVDEATFCARYSACGFDQFFPCRDLVNEFGREAGNELLTCLYERYEVCPRDPFEAFDQCFNGNPGQGNARACANLCAARSVCERLPAGQDRFACTNACTQAFDAGPDSAARAAAAITCNAAETCDELAACEAGLSTEPLCAEHCGRLEACGLAEADCPAECDRLFFRNRQSAVRTCVAAAADCGATAACLDAEPALCAARCAVEQRCGLRGDNLPPDLAAAACVARCDEADFADPDATVRLNVCYVTAPVCYANDIDRLHTVQACEFRSDAGGQDCLGYCRLQQGCADDDAALLGCLDRCSNDLTGDEAADLWVGGACLAQNPLNACEVLAACLPAPPPPCAAHCAAVATCDLDRPECADRCAADPLAEARARLDTPCLTAAGADCVAAEACVGGTPEVPPVDISQANYCRLHNGCGFAAEFACEELYQILSREGGPDGTGILACAVRTLEAACPRDPFAVFEFCFRGPTIDERTFECQALCQARAVCGDLPEGQRACQRRCQQAFAGGFDAGEGGGGGAGGGGEPPPDRGFDGDAPDEGGGADIAPPIDPDDPGIPGPGPGGLDPQAVRALAAELPCRFAYGCEALAECRVELAPANQCRLFCEARVACGELADQVGCEADCAAGFDRLRNAEHRACVRAAGDSCEAVAACAPRPGPDCDLYCRRQLECGFGGDPACVDRCDDDHFRNPVAQSTRVQCVIQAAECFDRGQGGAERTVDQCLFAPVSELIPAACQAWCRAVEDCDPEASRGLEGCLAACVTGFADPVEALGFNEAQGCLDRAGPAAACNALTACVPVDVEVRCPAHCESVSSCNIETAAACLAACDQAPPSLAEAACVAEAARLRQGCVTTAACVGFVAPPVSPTCIALCDEARRCDRFVDPFACRLTCDADPLVTEAVRACRRVSTCDQWPVCDALDGAADAACATTCGPVGACGFASAEHCGAACTGHRASPATNAEADAALIDCLDDAGGPQCQPAAVQACFEPPVGRLCDEACVVLIDCGFIEPSPECAEGCRQAADQGEPSASPEALQCLIEGLRQNGCDFGILERCLGFF